MSDVAGVFLALSLSLALCVYETLRRKMCCALQYEYDRHVNVMQVLCLTWLANCIYSPFVSISLFVFDFDMGYRNEVCFYLYVCLFFVTNCAVALSARLCDRRHIDINRWFCHGVLFRLSFMSVGICNIICSSIGHTGRKESSEMTGHLIVLS